MSDCLYFCRPERRIGGAIAVSALFFCASMAFSAVGLNSQLRRLFFLTAAVMLIICFEIVKRFLATAYSYAVYSYPELELVVYEHTLADKEPAIVCRIPIADIRDMTPKSGKKQKKTDGSDKIRADRYYNYTSSIFEREYITLTFAEGDDECALILTRDDGLVEIIKMLTH